jgi:UDP-N-acetylenolpyruvoylglucosamine reductase
LQAVAGEAKRRGLAGLEFLEGIPGTVGGALRMNAGAHGSWMFQCVERVRFCESDGTFRESPAADLAAAYRGCALLARRIAVEAVFRAAEGESGAILQRMAGFAARRRATQPREPSAGCIFKNPNGTPAGRLLDELGLKGTTFGGARVSDVHANFIVNTGDATARDVLALIEQLREQVADVKGFQLETEVEIIGED